MQTSTPVPLLPHPGNAPGPVRALAVRVTRVGNTLSLSYQLAAAPGTIRLPERAPALRQDELWRHTCFEAFIRRADAAAYLELNFAPSTQWAAYGFDSYRASRRDVALAAAPAIDALEAPWRFELHASVAVGRSDAGATLADAPWRVGVSAVIEATDGGLSYFALKFPPGKPDFHHPDAFVLEL